MASIADPRLSYVKHFLSWCVFSCLLVFLVFFQTSIGFLEPDVDPLVEFTMYESVALNSPTEAPSVGRTVQLPDDWHRSQRSNNDYWYSSEVEVARPLDAVWAVYLPFVTHNAAVYINGMWVGQGGRFADPVSRHHNEPLLFSFASELLRPGSNRIDIRVKAALPQQGLLDKVYLAPLQALQEIHGLKHWVRYDFIQWITAFLLVLGLLVFAFWLARPQDTIYATFSGVLVLWALHNFNIIVTEIPVSNKTWEAFTIVTLGWVVCSMLLFNHRYTGQHHPIVERIIWAYALSGLALFLLPSHEDVVFIGYRYWYFFLLLFGSYALYQLHRVVAQTGDFDALLMLYAGTTILITGMHDILLVNHRWDRREGFYIQYSVVPATLLFGWFLLKRFVTSLNTAEKLTDTLEQRISQRESEIQRQYDQLHEAEKKQILSHERERMMRDMHDGIGGQLISLATLFRHKGDPESQLAMQRIDNCLTDLRLVIDSLDPMLDDLATLLGTLRMRLTQLIEQAELDIDWQIGALPPTDQMGPQRKLHLLRILQEAITNAIRHSGADRIAVRTTWLPDQQLQIEIIDYGSGLQRDAEPTSSGRGLANMRYRANQLGGDLTVTSTSEGTRVCLTFNV